MAVSWDIDSTALVQFDEVTKDVSVQVTFTLETGTTNPDTGAYDDTVGAKTVSQRYSTQVKGDTAAAMIEDLHRQLQEAAFTLERQRRAEKQRWEAFTGPAISAPAFTDPRSATLPEDEPA